MLDDSLCREYSYAFLINLIKDCTWLRILHTVRSILQSSTLEHPLYCHSHELCFLIMEQREQILDIEEDTSFHKQIPSTIHKLFCYASCLNFRTFLLSDSTVLSFLGGLRIISPLVLFVVWPAFRYCSHAGATLRYNLRTKHFDKSTSPWYVRSQGGVSVQKILRA